MDPPAAVPVRNFRVFVDAQELALAQVSGLAAASGEPGAASGGPGAARVVLRRAVGADRTLFDWCQAPPAGPPGHTVYLDQYDAAGSAPINTWALVEAQPVRWTGPRFDALADEVAMEELEVAFARVEWLEPPGSRLQPPAPGG